MSPDKSNLEKGPRRAQPDDEPESAPRARTLMRWAEMPWSQMCAAVGISAGDGGPPPWPDAAKVKALKAAAATMEPGGLLTVERYMDWRADQADPGAYPSSGAFGPGAEEWLYWCERARVKGASKIRRPRFSDEEMLDHLIAAGDGSGRVGSGEYEQYRIEHPEAPSRSAYFPRFDSWYDAEDAAVALVARRKRQRRKDQPETAKAIEATPAQRKGTTPAAT